MPSALFFGGILLAAAVASAQVQPAPRIRTTAGSVEVHGNDLEVCRDGAPCKSVATADDLITQNTELRTLLGQERAASSRGISTLQAQLSTSVSSMAAFNNSFNQLAARMARLTAPEVVRLTCYGTNYVDAAGVCRPCVDAAGAPVGTHFYNQAHAACVHCSTDSDRFLDSGVCTLSTSCVAVRQYETAAVTPTTDRGCAIVASCSAAQYQSSAPTSTSNRVCTALTACNSTAWISGAHSATSDRVCTAHSPACTNSQLEVSEATATSDRSCQTAHRSCSDIREANASTHNLNGVYQIVRYNTTRTPIGIWAGLNCRDSGRIHGGNVIIPADPHSAPVYLEQIHFYSVFASGRRQCEWAVQGSDNNAQWITYGNFIFNTQNERHRSSGPLAGVKQGTEGADSNGAVSGGTGPTGCGQYSGWYTFRTNSSFGAHRWWRLRHTGNNHNSHCPRVGQLDFETRVASHRPVIHNVECDMVRGGWQLIYNRMNLFFTPDHMKQQCPWQQNSDLAMLNEDQVAWCIPNFQNRWKWDVGAIGDGSDFPPSSALRSVVTDIPDPAREANGGGNVGNYLLKRYGMDSNWMPRDHLYYQRFVSTNGFPGRGCGGRSKFGLMRTQQGGDERFPGGIGGSCDGCQSTGTNSTWNSGNLEYYLGSWRDQWSNGARGSVCVPRSGQDFNRARYWWNYRFWSIGSHQNANTVWS